MMMKFDALIARAVLAAGIAGLASCGGGGGGGASAVPAGSSATAAPQSVAVTFTIVIPRPTSSSSRTAKYISVSTASATVTVNAGAPVSNACSTTCTFTVDAPIGPDTFAVTLKDSSSNVLSQGSASATISPTIANVVNVAFGGVVKKIQLSSTVANLVPGTLATTAPVTVAALDADNNTIIGSDAFVNAISLSNSDSSGATNLSTTSVTSPATTVSLTYTGAGSLAGGSATITPSATGASGNTPVTFNVYAHHTILEYPISGSAYLNSVATGSDGNLWFGDQNAHQIGYVTPAGVVETFPTTDGMAYIAKGSDGNIWFTEVTTDRVGRVTPAGVVTDFTGLSTTGEGIALGSNGDLYVAEFGSGSPGRVAQVTTGGTITESAQLSGQPQLQGIALGSDNRLWTTEPFSQSTMELDAMTTSFAFTRYSIPSNAVLRDITSGPDGNLWIVDSGNNQIDKVNTSGTFLNEYAPPGAGADGMTVGSDGKLYFAEYSTNDIASITTSGTTASYTIPTSNAGANFAAVGPDGNIWFPEVNAGKIGRFII